MRRNLDARRTRNSWPKTLLCYYAPPAFRRRIWRTVQMIAADMDATQTMISGMPTTNGGPGGERATFTTALTTAKPPHTFR